MEAGRQHEEDSSLHRLARGVGGHDEEDRLASAEFQIGEREAQHDAHLDVGLVCA